MILNLNFKNYERVMNDFFEEKELDIIELNLKSKCNRENYKIQFDEEIIFRNKYVNIILRRIVDDLYICNSVDSSKMRIIHSDNNAVFEIKTSLDNINYIKSIYFNFYIKNTYNTM